MRWGNSKKVECKIPKRYKNISLNILKSIRMCGGNNDINERKSILFFRAS